MPTRYLEIRGFAEITDDPQGTLNRKMFRRMSGKEMDLDEPGAERVIIRIIPTQVSRRHFMAASSTSVPRTSMQSGTRV